MDFIRRQIRTYLTVKKIAGFCFTVIVLPICSLIWQQHLCVPAHELWQVKLPKIEPPFTCKSLSSKAKFNNEPKPPVCHTTTIHNYQQNILCGKECCQVGENLNSILPRESDQLSSSRTKPTSQTQQQQQQLKPTSPENESELEHKRQFIRDMTFEAWQNYVRHAWGASALKPTTNETFGEIGSGRTIIASMSTLWVMGFEAEFERAKRWIENDFKFDRFDPILVYDAVSEYIGGLLSCYALTGDRIFLRKAEEIAQQLEPAYPKVQYWWWDIGAKLWSFFYSSFSSSFSSSSSSSSSTQELLPTNETYRSIDPKNRKGIDSGELSHSHISGQQLEFGTLANLTNDWKLRYRVEHNWKWLRQVDKPRGLYRKDSLSKDEIHMLTNLVKSYIQSGGANPEPLEWYIRAIDTIEQNRLITITSDDDRNNRYYARKYSNFDYQIYQSDQMDSSACQLGVMFALGAYAMKQSQKSLSIVDSDERHRASIHRINRHWQLAEELTDTCHYGSNKTATGLPPFKFYFGYTYSKSNQYYLEPELAESYFILWRMTHDPRYRQYAWEMAQAIRGHCRTQSGYTVIKDVTRTPTFKTENYQPPHFLSVTLKYLYMTFTDDSVLPLDLWIFNAAGHPLKVIEQFSPNSNPKQKSVKPIETEYSDIDLERKRNTIKDMTLKGWNAYKRYAWGYDALKPLTNEPWDSKRTGKTIIYAMSTLWLMDLRDEFNQGKRWITDQFGQLDDSGDQDAMYDRMSQFVGPLVSCYALTNETIFLTKAQEIVNSVRSVLRATKTNSQNRNYFENRHYNSNPQMALKALSNYTNDWLIREEIEHINDLIAQAHSKIAREGSHLIKRSDYFDTKLKLYIQSGHKESLQMYQKAVESLEELVRIDKQNHYYLSITSENNEMSVESCKFGAILSLGAKTINESIWHNKTIDSNERRLSMHRINRQWQLAEELIESCHNAAMKTKTGLIPAIFNIIENDQTFTNDSKTFQFASQLAESYFILWRLTHRAKYRQYAWEMVQAIQTYCRTGSGGYTELTDVNQKYTQKYGKNYQPPYLFSQTLKYLYLTFTDNDDSVLPLDRWLFTYDGHPLPRFSHSR